LSPRLFQASSGGAFAAARKANFTNLPKEGVSRSNAAATAAAAGGGIPQGVAAMQARDFRVFKPLRRPYSVYIYEPQVSYVV